MSQIAITGTNSFTGVWMANHLAKSNEVCGFTTQNLESYSGLKKIRLEFLDSKIKVFPDTKAEDGSFKRWIQLHKPQVWIHHHHHMENFRLKTYDSQKAQFVTLQPLQEMVESLAQNKALGIVYSSSYFEYCEGGKPENAELLPYAVSKTATYLELQRLCKLYNLKLVRVVLPNPFGPLENSDRLIPNLLKKSLKGETLNLTAPNVVADNIPPQAFIQSYEKAVQWVIHSKESNLTLRPSGWVCTNAEFVNTICEKLIQNYLSIKPCSVEVSPPLANPTKLSNPQNEKADFDIEEVLFHYAQILKKFPLDMVLQ